MLCFYHGYASFKILIITVQIHSKEIYFQNLLKGDNSGSVNKTGFIVLPLSIFGLFFGGCVFFTLLYIKHIFLWVVKKYFSLNCMSFSPFYI